LKTLLREPKRENHLVNLEEQLSSRIERFLRLGEKE
jgi:hypothetical protein